MSREQIEKIAKIIARRSKAFRNPNVAFMTSATKTADSLYNAGYREQREVAREIFEELDNRLDDISVVSANGDGFTMGVGKTFEKVTGIVEELKKKYLGEQSAKP